MVSRWSAGRRAGVCSSCWATCRGPWRSWRRLALPAATCCHRGRSWTARGCSRRPAWSTAPSRCSTRARPLREPAASLTTSPRPTSSGPGSPCSDTSTREARRLAARAERRFARGRRRHGPSVPPCCGCRPRCSGVPPRCDRHVAWPRWRTAPRRRALSGRRPRCSPLRPTRVVGRVGCRAALSWPAREVRRGDGLSPSGSNARWRWPSCTPPRAAPTSCAASCGGGRTASPSSRPGTPRSTRAPPPPCTPAGCATPTSTSPSPPAHRRRSSTPPSCGAVSRNDFPDWWPRTTSSWPASPPTRAACTPRRSTPPTAHARAALEAAAREAERAVARRDWAGSGSDQPHAEEKPVTVAALRPLLDQARAGLLSLFIHRGRLWAVTVTPGGAKLTRVPDGARVVEAAARLRADLPRAVSRGEPLSRRSSNARCCERLRRWGRCSPPSCHARTGSSSSRRPRWRPCRGGWSPASVAASSRLRRRRRSGPGGRRRLCTPARSSVSPHWPAPASSRASSEVRDVERAWGIGPAAGRHRRRDGGAVAKGPVRQHDRARRSPRHPRGREPAVLLGA